MLRFIPAIVLVQIISITLFWVNTEAVLDWSNVMLLKIGVPLILISVIAALWFDTIGRQRAIDTIARLKVNHAKDREKLQLKTEKEKSKILKDAQKEISKQGRRVSTRANLKVGLAFVGVAFAGLVMIITELVTFGMMTIMTAGGALGGYLARVKQEFSSSTALEVDSEQPRIVNQQTGVVVSDSADQRDSSP